MFEDTLYLVLPNHGIVTWHSDRSQSWGARVSAPTITLGLSLHVATLASTSVWSKVETGLPPLNWLSRMFGDVGGSTAISFVTEVGPSWSLTPSVYQCQCLHASNNLASSPPTSPGTLESNESGQVCHFDEPDDLQDLDLE